MVKYLCDRCEEELENSSCHEIKFEDQDRLYNGVKQDYHYFTRRICKVCYRSFTEWFRNESSRS